MVKPLAKGTCATFFFMDCMEKGYQGLCSKSTTIETLILWPTNKLFLQYGSSCLKIETWPTVGNYFDSKYLKICLVSDLNIGFLVPNNTRIFFA